MNSLLLAQRDLEKEDEAIINELCNLKYDVQRRINHEGDEMSTTQSHVPLFTKMGTPKPSFCDLLGDEYSDEIFRDTVQELKRDLLREVRRAEDRNKVLSKLKLEPAIQEKLERALVNLAKGNAKSSAEMRKHVRGFKRPHLWRRFLWALFDEMDFPEDDEALLLKRMIPFESRTDVQSFWLEKESQTHPRVEAEEDEQDEFFELMRDQAMEELEIPDFMDSKE